MGFPHQIVLTTDDLKPVSGGLTQSDTVAYGACSAWVLMSIVLENTGTSALTAAWDLKVTDVETGKVLLNDDDATNAALAAGATDNWDLQATVVDQDDATISGASRNNIVSGKIKVEYTGVAGESVQVRLIGMSFADYCCCR